MQVIDPSTLRIGDSHVELVLACAPAVVSSLGTRYQDRIAHHAGLR